MAKYRKPPSRIRYEQNHPTLSFRLDLDKRGFTTAENQFKVAYPCSICGKFTTVTQEDEKQAIRQYMKEHGWGHRVCHEKAK